MKNYYFLIIGIIVLLFAGVFAQELPGVIFPVAELGNCASKEECKIYCDKPENMSACLDFAEEHNLIPESEIKMARKMLEMGDIGGPGNCRGKAECEVYCDNPDHMEECIIFAKKHGLIPPDELEEVEKILAAIQKGYKPPACHGKAACDTYCSVVEHFEECITFGEAAGLIPPDEIDEAKKALEAVKKGAKLPACQGKAECDVYCAQEEHFEECLTFAEAAGFISPEEAAMAKRTGGKGPGGCRGKEVCNAYCEDPVHMEECVNFAEEFGFISHEDAENARKMLKAGFTGGPGGCKGKEECEAYCNDLVHLEECVDFAEKMGFMTPEDANRARKMAERGINVMEGGPGGCKSKEECEAFCQNPANMEECINFAVQIGEMTPEQAEQAKKGMEMMQKGGPGGCKNEQECKTYCEDPTHSEECLNFSVEQGFISPEEAQKMREMQQMQPMVPSQPPPEEGLPPMPSGFEGKCNTPENCMQYCLQNPTDPTCQAIKPPQGITPPPTEAPPTEALPQTLFDPIRNFLAQLISFFLSLMD